VWPVFRKRVVFCFEWRSVWKDWFNSFVMSFERSIGLCQQKKVGGAKKYYFAKLLNSNFFLRMEAYQKTWVRSTGLGGRGGYRHLCFQIYIWFFSSQKIKVFLKCFAAFLMALCRPPSGHRKKLGEGRGELKCRSDPSFLWVNWYTLFWKIESLKWKFNLEKEEFLTKNTVFA